MAQRPADVDSDFQSDSDDDAQDKNFRYSVKDGLPQDDRSGNTKRVKWTSMLAAESFDPNREPWSDTLEELAKQDRECGKRWYEKSVLGYEPTQLIRPELMSDPRRNFATLASEADQMTRDAVDTLFDRRQHTLKQEYRRLGIWGSDHEDSWIFVVERLYVQEEARRTGLATILTTRVLKELTALAGAAGKAVVVLVMPGPPEKEIAKRTAGLSLSDRRNVQAQYVRYARAFWRALGFVRIAETMWFGWTRHIGEDVVRKVKVGDAVLDYDASIDHRYGYLDRMF